VALKRQFLDNGHVNPQHLWRVDGKSLLQKFTRCNEDNNMYKSVSTVSRIVKPKIDHIYI